MSKKNTNQDKYGNIRAKIILYDDSTGARIMNSNLMNYNDAIKAAERIIQSKYNQEAKNIKKFMQMQKGDRV